MEFKSPRIIASCSVDREHECLIVLEAHENYSSVIFKPCYRKQPLKSRFLCKNPAFYRNIYIFVKILLFYVKKLFFMLVYF